MFVRLRRIVVAKLSEIVLAKTGSKCGPIGGDSRTWRSAPCMVSGRLGAEAQADDSERYPRHGDRYPHHVSDEVVTDLIL